MSRLARKPIIVPEKVKVNFQDNIVEVNGPLGNLSQKIPQVINLVIENSKISVKRNTDEKSDRMFQGLACALIKNMIIGVTLGFRKDLEIRGLGYQAKLSDKKLIFRLGFSHPVEYKIPEGIKVTVGPKGTLINVSGIDKQLVGEIAAEIRRLKPPEHYKGTGIRYVGEVVIKKAGKAAVGMATAGGAAVGGAGAKK